MALFKLNQDVSKKKPTVFVHGGPGANSGLFLGALLRHGSKHLQSLVTLHDQPDCGFDMSLVDIYTFESLCEHLRVDLSSFSKVQLLAESFGCTLALEFASRHPEKVESLTLVGPHFDRKQAQKNIYQRSALVAQHLIADLKETSSQSEFLGRFLQGKKEKFQYRKSSSKKHFLGKDFVRKEWSQEKAACFEKELSKSLEQNKASNFLQVSLMESFEEDLKIFELSSGKDIPVSTETLKGFAKKYELFFTSSAAFTEVKNCRDVALRLPYSPYSAELLDRSNKKFAMDLETATDWETQSRWPLVKQVVEQGVQVNIITGSHDPFATGFEFTSLLNKNKNYKSYVLDQVGHSPIYENPKMTFHVLESVLYGI